MTSQPKNGGSAFPMAVVISPAGDVHQGSEGMSLRDWFAGQADISVALDLLHREGCEELIGKKMPEDFTGILNWQFEVVAALRMIAADAMLRARGQS